MPPIVTDVSTAWSVWPSVTLLLQPAKAVGRNEMPFDREIRVVPSSTTLDRVLDPPWEGEIRGSEPPVHNTLPITKLLWPLLSIFAACKTKVNDTHQQAYSPYQSQRI